MTTYHMQIIVSEAEHDSIDKSLVMRVRVKDDDEFFKIVKAAHRGEIRKITVEVDE